MKHKERIVGTYFVQGGNFQFAGMVSSEIKRQLADKGVDKELLRKIAVVVFEAEVNIISYAGEGFIYYRVNPDKVLIEAIDQGPGIADIELALQEGYSTANDKIREMGFGAGMGLANIKRFSDEFQIVSEFGKGTYLKMIINQNKPSKPKTEE